MGSASEAHAAITRAFPCVASASIPSKAALLMCQSDGPYRPCHAFTELFAKPVYVLRSCDYGLAVGCTLPRSMAACAMAVHAVFMATPLGSRSDLLSA